MLKVSLPPLCFLRSFERAWSTPFFQPPGLVMYIFLSHLFILMDFGVSSAPHQSSRCPTPSLRWRNGPSPFFYSEVPHSLIVFRRANCELRPPYHPHHRAEGPLFPFSLFMSWNDPIDPPPHSWTDLPLGNPDSPEVPLPFFVPPSQNGKKPPTPPQPQTPPNGMCTSF